MITVSASSIVFAMDYCGEEDAVFDRVSSILSKIQAKDVPESTYNELKDGSKEELYVMYNVIGYDLVIGIDDDNDIVYGTVSDSSGPFYHIEPYSYEEFIEEFGE